MYRQLQNFYNPRPLPPHHNNLNRLSIDSNSSSVSTTARKKNSFSIVKLTVKNNVDRDFNFNSLIKKTHRYTGRTPSVVAKKMAKNVYKMFFNKTIFKKKKFQINDLLKFYNIDDMTEPVSAVALEKIAEFLEKTDFQINIVFKKTDSVRYNFLITVGVKFNYRFNKKQNKFYKINSYAGDFTIAEKLVKNISLSHAYD